MRNFCLLFLSAILAAGCGNSGKEHTAAPTDSPQQSAVETQDTASIPAETTQNEPAALHTGQVWFRSIGDYAEVFNDSNYRQYYYAERLGIEPIHTLKDAYYTRRPLLKIESCNEYTVDHLTHSMPFLVPEAARLLSEIGTAFGDSIEKRGGDRKNKFIVTSLLRSPYSVKKLMTVNKNAVDSSTHKFATTFDICYNNFDSSEASRPLDPVKLKGILAEVLLQQRNEGKCLVKYEKKSPCFHITVCR